MQKTEGNDGSIEERQRHRNRIEETIKEETHTERLYWTEM
jgi:hypothetical protein